MHLVKVEFFCPHCGAKLRSNIDRAFAEGFAFFLAVGGIWLAWRFFAGVEVFGPASSIALIAIFYLAHFWYRWRLRVCIARFGPKPDVQQRGRTS
jgi:hypothetical protein